MSKAQGYPHKQSFNIKDIQRNKTKRKAWWQAGNSNNVSQIAKKKED